MSYLKFDKNLLINLEQSLSREILRTNKSGAYHSTTIVGCNTRKQHGLLVIPNPQNEHQNHVLLSSLDETIIQHGAPFNLGIHNFGGDIYSPNGHKYIREFTFVDVPKSIYRVGGVVFSKEKIFVSHENRILIKYTLMEARSETTLQFRPFLAFRDANDICVENNTINKSYNEVKNGISCCLYNGYSTLYMQFSKKVEYVFDPNWHNGIEYHKDRERGYSYKEDLFVPGYFQVPIKKGESIIFSAGVDEISPRSLNTLYNKEIEMKVFRNSFYNCLKNSAQQFYIRKENDSYILAGYPWYNIRARDLFISAPGCSLYIDDKVEFKNIMQAALTALQNFMKSGEKDTAIDDIEKPDIALWAIWSIQQYAQATSIEECKKVYGKVVDEIINYIISNNHPNLKVDDNGLLHSDGHEGSISWMESHTSPKGDIITYRSGYLVEFNALWYNALNFYLQTRSRKSKTTEMVSSIIDKLNVSFKETFLNEHGYLYDFVDGGYKDLSVRPNMIFAASLEFSPLNRQERKSVLDIVTKELLTPKGIRTLSPNSYGYSPVYYGSKEDREKAHYQGTARPWLMGAYAEAYLKTFALSGVSFIERMLTGFDEDMSNSGIGTLSELFDGNPPYAGRGGISFAMNVAEILRVLNLLKKYNNSI